MARLLNCGFEVASYDIFDYLPGTQTSWFSATGNAHDQSRYCFKVGYYTNGFNLGTDVTEFYFGCRFLTNQVFRDGGAMWTFFSRLNFQEMGRFTTESGAQVAYRAGSNKWVSTKALENNRWYWFEGHILFHQSAGVVQLKVDGETWIDVSGIDTIAAADDTSMRWFMLDGVGTGNYDPRHDDLVINDTSGSGPLTNRSWPGEVVVALQPINADVDATQEWDSSGMTGTPGAYATEVNADSPALFWRFNETSGSSANDDTANNHDGTIGAGVMLAQDGITGDGPGFYLPVGGTSNIEHANHADLNMTSAITLEVWGKGFWNDALNGGQRVIAGKWGQYQLRYDPPNFYWSVWVGGNRYDLTSDSVQEENAASPEYHIGFDEGWHHIVATWDDTTDAQEIWLDGQKIGSRTQNGPLSTTTNVFRVGWAASGSFDVNFFGWLDDFAIYPTALSETRIKTHHRAGKKNYELVDDYFPNIYDEITPSLAGNADLEYLSTTAANKKALFETEDVDARYPMAQSVTVWVGARKAEPTASGIRVLIKRAGNEALGDQWNLLSRDKVFRHTFDRDTTDTSDWSPTKVNNLQVGIKSV